MRKILFRGKEVNSGIWVHGSLITSAASDKVARIVVSDDVDEMYFEEYDVDPDSVGQFTGFTDANEEKIFEGDTLNNGRYTVLVIWQEKWGEWNVREHAKNVRCNLHLFLEGYPKSVIKKGKQ